MSNCFRNSLSLSSLFLFDSANALHDKTSYIIYYGNNIGMLVFFFMLFIITLAWALFLSLLPANNRVLASGCARLHMACRRLRSSSSCKDFEERQTRIAS